MTPKQAVTIALTAVAATACSVSDPNTPWSEDAVFVNVDPDGWLYGDTLHVMPPSHFGHPSGTARMAVAVRHGNGFEYSNLWLEITTPAGPDSMRVDTVNVRLADVYGNWLGTGPGVSVVTSDTLAGVYGYDSIRPAAVRHIMRVDNLKNIEQIGLVYFDPR